MTNGSIGSILERSTRGLAAYAAEDLIARLDSPQAQAEDAFTWWHAFFEGRFKDLAAAVDADQPRLFVSQMRWCRAAMKARQVDNGHIRQAIDAMRDVVVAQTGQAGESVAAEFIDAALRDCDTNVDLPDSWLNVGTPHGRLAAEFVLCVLEGRRRDAAQVLLKAVDDGLAVKDAYLNVIIPAVREIGRMWHIGEVTVAEEHFASDTAQMVIAQLQSRATVAPPIGRTMLAASVAGNRHDLGTRILANLFEIEGWRVVCLGGDVPGSDVAQAVIDFEADLLLLSATLHTQLRAVERTIHLVRQRADERPVRVIAGGLAFDEAPDLSRRFGADGYALTADEALDLGRQWFDPERSD